MNPPDGNRARLPARPADHGARRRRGRALRPAGVRGRARRAARLGGAEGLAGRGGRLGLEPAGRRRRGPGLVLKLAGELAAIERDGERVVCGGGVRLPSAAAKVAGWGLGGLEFGINIPGTVGGAVRMNANAYGGELAKVLEWVDVCTADGAERRGPGRARASPTADRTCARARSSRGRRSRSRRPTRRRSRRSWPRCAAKRREAQPSGIKTFGSTFKNPDPRPRASRAGPPVSCSRRRAAAGSRSAAPASRPSTPTSSRTRARRPPPTCSA